MSLSSGARLGPFEVVSPLGAGGMGEVYRARDVRLGRDVALKVLPEALSADRERLARFEQEARSASALNHPHIVTVYDVGQSDTGPWIAMELVEGRTLRELVSAGSLPAKRCLSIAAQTADALAKAHAAGIVHRDLKPENLMVSKDGFVKILDFGLAKLMAPLPSDSGSLAATAINATVPGTLLGTVGYMSPEQAAGGSVDFRSDQFSFGSILYEMATGGRPFHKMTAAETMTAIIREEPEPLSRAAPSAPPPYRWIVERCLAKDPEDRYSSTLDLAHELATLRDHLSEVSRVDEAAVEGRPASGGRGRFLLAFLSVGLACLALGAVLAFLWQGQTQSDVPAIRYLTHSGRDGSPAASPDGRTIAFSSDRDGVRRIWLKQLIEGDEVSLTTGEDDFPRFSADGSAILFSRTEQGQTSLFRVPSLGGEPRRLVNGVLSGDWSPDGRQVVFVRWEVFGGSTSTIVGVAASSDGAGAREVARFDNVTLIHPRWSPDSRTIALSETPLQGGGNPTAVYVVDSARREAAVAVRIYDERRDPTRLVAALLFVAETAWQLRLPDETRRWVEQALPLARETGATDTLTRTLSLAATLANLAGEYDRANALLEEAARLGTDAVDVQREAEIPIGGRLVVALASPVRDIEPVATTIIEESEIGATIFETLLTTDARGHLVPWLCERWEAGPNARVFGLTLRRDVHFSDGTPLTAAAVKLSIETSSRSAANLPAAFAAIAGMAAFRAGESSDLAGVEAISDTDLHISLDESLPILPALLTEGSTAVVSPRETAPGVTGVIGTGPFHLTSLAADKVVVERNDSYWRAGLPRLDAIEFHPSLQPPVIARKFRGGDLDLARDLLPRDLEEILRDPGSRQRLVEAPKKNTYFVLFNAVSGPVTRALAVRRALAGVLKPRDLVWRTLGRFAEPAASLIPPGMLGHDAGRRWPSMPRDAALAALREAGIEAGTTLAGSIQPLLRDRTASLLAGLFETWSDLGIEVAAEPLDMPAFLSTWKDNAAVDLTIGRWNADYDDPDNFTYSLFHSGSGALHNYFSSPEADKRMEEARAESQPALRDALYRRIENLLLEAAVLVPLFHDIDYRLASPKVRGLVLRGTKPYLNYAEVGVAVAERPAEARRATGGTIHVPMTSGITSLDLKQRSTAELGEVLPCIFQTLTSEKGGLAQIVPCLAASFRIEDGGQRYRFFLREDVRFHNGRRLTARDVRYSLERLLLSHETDLESFAIIRGARALLSGQARDLVGLRIHSATEFSIELEEPVAFFPALLSHYQTAIIPEGGEPPASTPHAWSGTGPFRIASFEPGRRLELERNKTYWRQGYPRSEGLVFHFGVTPKEILGGLRDGRFSLGSELLPADVEELRRQPEFASGYRETPRLVTYFVAFNTRRGPLSSHALRLRLARSVDIPRLIRQTLGRLAIPAHGIIPPGLLGHDPEAAPRRSHDSSDSSETRAGSLELTAAVHPVLAGPYAAVTRELSNAFGAQGVALRPVTTSMVEFLQAHREGTADVYVGRWNADYPDPDSFASIFHSQTGFLGRACGSAEIDRLIARARTESVPALRHALYRELEDMLAADAIILPMFHEQAYRIARPEVDGLTLGLGTPTVSMEDLRIAPPGQVS